MGAYKDYIDSLVPSGITPLFGTIVPQGEFSGMPAVALKGGYFSVPNNDVLADIPLDLLSVDMEVVVSAHDTFDRTRYRLATLPPSRISDIISYDILDYWEEVPNTITETGLPGNNAWSPVFASEEDGPTRVVLKVIGYVNGQGDPPAIVVNNNYLGPSGLTTKSLATNFKGNTGSAGSPPASYFANVNSRHTLGTTFYVQNSAFGTEENVSNGSLTITNTGSTTRRFRVWAEISIRVGDSGEGWFVLLFKRVDVEENNFVLAEQMAKSFSNTINASRDSALRYQFEWNESLIPGESMSYYMTMLRTSGGRIEYTRAYIEATGL
jgi:hypothetical protein